MSRLRRYGLCGLRNYAVRNQIKNLTTTYFVVFLFGNFRRPIIKYRIKKRKNRNVVKFMARICSKRLSSEIWNRYTYRERILYLGTLFFFNDGYSKYWPTDFPVI